MRSLSSRGFTGHEMLDEVGLVHMNGRIYDPLLGRFMTPDPVSESVTLLQALNRYAYVGNNPLSFTDASGYSWLSKLFRKIPILRAIFAIIVAVVFQQWEALSVAFGEVGASFVAGFASGLTSGGLKGALLGGFQAVASFGIGEMLEHGVEAIRTAADAAKEMLRAGLHGFVGGMVSVANGGDFGSGFLSAGFSSLSGAVLPDMGFAGNLAARAIVGGAASVLGGGKFENGAITAAFAYLFNEAISNSRFSVRLAFSDPPFGTVCVFGMRPCVHTQIQLWENSELAYAIDGGPAGLASVIIPKELGVDGLIVTIDNKKLDSLIEEYSIDVSAKEYSAIIGASVSYCNCLNYTLPYRYLTPYMRPGTYNSNALAYGILAVGIGDRWDPSVVDKYIWDSGYQAPGLMRPVPARYFK